MVRTRIIVFGLSSRQRRFGGNVFAEFAGREYREPEGPLDGFPLYFSG